jgi:hypothetical protein
MGCKPISGWSGASDPAPAPPSSRRKCFEGIFEGARGPIEARGVTPKPCLRHDGRQTPSPRQIATESTMIMAIV